MVTTRLEGAYWWRRRVCSRGVTTCLRKRPPNSRSEQPLNAQSVALSVWGGPFCVKIKRRKGFIKSHREGEGDMYDNT